MLYQARAPRGPLGGFVKCLWRLRGDAAEIDAQPILPDGCFELIVHLGEPFVEAGPAAVRQDRLLLAATLTRTVVVAAFGAVDVIGVRFLPGAAYPFLAIAPVEVVDRVAPAIDVVARELIALLERLEPAPTDELFDRVEAALSARLARAGRDGRLARPSVRRLLIARF